jgi:hypothetical protein
MNWTNRIGMRWCVLAMAATLAQAGCTPAAKCEKGSTECDGACVRLTSDNLNCGACGTTCGGGQVCSAGSCGVTCQASLTTCGGTCTDLQTENNNCGACGTSCAAGQVCAGGTCGLTCQSGLTNCAGTCTDLQSENDNCGACGNVCGGGACVAGACTFIAGRYWPVSGSASFAANFLLGTQISLPAGRVVSLTNLVPAADAGKHVKMALYADSAGSPGALVASTTSSTLITGLNLLAVTPLTLTAGRYWIMANYEVSATGYQDTDVVTIKYVALPFASALPATFPAAATYTSGSFAYGVQYSP